MSKKWRKNFSLSDEEHIEDNPTKLKCPNVPPGLANPLVKSVIQPNKLTFHPRLRNIKNTAKSLQAVVSNTISGKYNFNLSLTRLKVFLTRLKVALTLTFKFFIIFKYSDM